MSDRRNSNGKQTNSDNERDDSQDESRPKKKSRIAQACKTCGTRKQKCDGQQPCKSCVNAKIADTCEYRVAKKRGPPKGYTRTKKDSVSAQSAGEEAGSVPAYSMPPTSTSKPDQLDDMPSRDPAAYTSLPTSQYTMAPQASSSSSGLVPHMPDPYLQPPSQYTQTPNFSMSLPGLQPLSQKYPGASTNNFSTTPHMVMPASPVDSNPWPALSTMSNYPHPNTRPQTTYAGDMDAAASQSLLALKSDLRSPASSSLSAYPLHGAIDSTPQTTRLPSLSNQLTNQSWESSDVAMSRIDAGYRGSTSGLPAIDSTRGNVPDAMRVALARRHAAASATLNLNPPPKTSLSAILHDYERSVDRSFLSHALKDVSPTGTGSNNSAPDPGELPFDEEVPQAVVERLISIFFTFAHSLWPVVYGRERTSEALSSEPVLFNAACAIAARTLEGLPEDTPGEDPVRYSGRSLGTLYHNRARFHLVQSNNESSIPVLQGLIFMTLREMGTGRSAQGWQYSGIASRMALDLGLHRHPDVNTAAGFKFSPVETEERIRSFWGVYILDKMCSAVLGRPVLLRSEDLDCPLPRVQDKNDLSETGTWDISYLRGLSGGSLNTSTQLCGVSAFKAFASLACILENIITGVYSVQRRRKWREDVNHITLQEISAQLEDWRAELPPHLAWGPHISRMGSHLLVMNAVFFLCHLLLHRTYIPVAPSLTYKGIPMPSSHQICTNAADSICKIAENYHRNFGFRKVSTQMVYVIFTAAAMQVANRASADPQLAEKAQRSLQQCMGWLEELSGSWTLAAHHRQILLELDEVGQNELTASRVPQSSSQSRAPSPAVGHSAIHLPGSAAPASAPDMAPSPLAMTNGNSNVSVQGLWGFQQDHNSADLLFWNEMPISMEASAWTAFTNNYSSQLSELENLHSIDSTFAGSGL